MLGFEDEEENYECRP